MSACLASNVGQYFQRDMPTAFAHSQICQKDPLGRKLGPKSKRR